jgi:phospholipid/cholesterol/gamma-HCH transport system permease protein
MAAFGAGAEFFWNTTVAGLGGRVRPYGSEVGRQIGILTTGSALIVLGFVFALGLVVGIQGSYGAQMVGAPAAAGAITAIADLREIAPYAFGYMMSAKVGTGLVADIGTRRITEEIDALDVMGVDSLAYLCGTRLVAAIVLLPFIYAIAIVAAFVGSFISVVVQIGQVSAGGYLELFWKFQSPADYLFSATKGMAMAVFAVLVGCYYGYTVRGGPVEVGRATARSMLVSLIGVHVIGIAGSQLFWGGSARLPIGG